VLLTGFQLKNLSKSDIKEKTQNCSSFPFYFLVLHHTKKETHKPFGDHYS